jgi:hypothetical protein
MKTERALLKAGSVQVELVLGSRFQNFYVAREADFEARMKVGNLPLPPPGGTACN